MSRRSSAAATKRRHVNDAKPPAPKSDWLSVFAAASMFIGDDVMEGSLFPMTSSSGRSTSTCSAQTGTSNSAAAAHHSHEEEYTAKDFGPITFHGQAAFYQLIDRLYAALQEEQLKKNDPSLASVYIYSANPTPFKKYLRFCGYGAVANGKHNAGVFVKRANFHLVPDPKTVAIVSRTLMGVGYRYKANKSLRGQWPIASSVMQCPLPAEGTHWLDLFAAVAMYIDNSVMRGGLFAKPGAKSQSADDFDRIVIYSRSRFFRAAHHLYSAIKREQSTRRDPALTSIRIFCPNPETFVAQLGRFGYRRVDGGGSMTTKNENENEVQEEQPEVYAKDPAFHTHISPNAERALIIYNILKEMDFLPKQGFGLPCHSKESTRIPNPSPTTVADTGFTAVGHNDATTTGTTTASATTTMKSAVTKSIPELHHCRDSDASTEAATTFVGKVTIDKSIVPSTIAHHAAITAFRTATKSAAKSAAKSATGTLGMNWDCIPGTTSSAVHGSTPPPPLSFMMPNRQIKEGSVAEGVTITPPKLITIEDDGQYPSLPLSASNATGTSFVPWVDVTEAPASDVPEERGTMDVEEGLNIPEWYKNVEEYHNGNNLLPIGAKNGALVPSGEDGDDHLSVMTTFSPISAAIAMAEDDLSSCPSIDGQDDALIPFIDYL